ncbi:MAG: WD40/YVTN/BNR-like repeat-containing protein [Sulfuricaulis sp.]
MRRVVVSFCLWLFVAASPVHAHGGSPLNFKGSEGGSVRAIVITPTRPAILYAATSGGGVFRSRDGGSHWQPANRGLPRMDILALALDPASPRTLYAGTRGGLFKSHDGGASWQPAGAGLGEEQIKVLLTDPANARTLYAGTYHGLWKSADEGQTWSRLAGQPESSNITALAIAQDASHGMYAGTAQGLFRSRDGGATWSRLSRGLSVPSIATLVVDPVRPQVLYAGTADGAYRSDDGGDTWHSITFAQTNLPVTAILVDPRHPDTLYLGTSFVGGLFKTEDAGKSWMRIRGEDFTPSITALVFPSDDSKVLIAGTSFLSQVFISRNSGMTWKASLSGPTLPVLRNLSGTPDGKFLYAAAQTGIYRFQEARETWQWVGNPGVGVVSKVLYRHGAAAQLWVCGSKGVAEGVVNGKAWIFHRSTAVRKACADMALDGESGRVFVSTVADLWVKSDRWRRHAIPTQGKPVHAIDLGKDGKTVYVLTKHQALSSGDQGKTWESLKQGGVSIVTAVAETGTAPATAWIATNSDIAYRTPAGKWTNASEGIFPPGVGAIVESPGGDRLYATSLITGRLFERRTGEAAWSSSDIGEGSADISDLWVDGAHEGVLYAATRNSGLYRSKDFGKHWQAVNTGLAAR